MEGGKFPEKEGGRNTRNTVYILLGNILELFFSLYA